MPVNNIYSGVDECMREDPLGGWDHVTPIATPMDRRDDHVADLLCGCYSPCDEARGRRREIGQQVDARLV